MQIEKFIKTNFPEPGGLLWQRFEVLQQLVKNDFKPGSIAEQVLRNEYGNDIRSQIIKYDYLEVENEVLIKSLNNYLNAKR